MAMAWAAIVLALGFSSSSQAQIAFEIGEVSAQAGQTVQVPVSIQTSGLPASTAVLFLEFDAGKLSVTGVAGGAALPPGKEVQSNVGDGEIGLIAFGLGEAPLADGVLFMVSFDTANASSGDTLIIRGAKASAADIGATVLEVSVADGAIALGCPGVGIPVGIQATGDNPEGISISWASVSGAVEYRVYRSETAVASSAVAVSGWLAETAFFDDTVPAPSGGGISCAPESDNAVFYYWVAARSSAECESGLGGPAAGSRAAKRLPAGYALGFPLGAPGWAGPATLASSASSFVADAALLCIIFVLLAIATSKRRNFEFPISDR